MYIRPITREETTITVTAEPEDIPVRGNASASGDERFDREVENGLLERLDRGDVWAWASVTVTVSWDNFEAPSHLGCCSYEDEQDFRQAGGHFDDMIAEALDEVNQEILDLYSRLKTREQDTACRHS